MIHYVRNGVFAGSLGLVSSIALAVVATSGGCTYDKSAAQDDAEVVAPDSTSNDAKVRPPEVTVLVSGTDIPADLSCVGKPRPPVMIKDGGVDTGSGTDTGADADGDTGTTDSGSDTLDLLDASVEASSPPAPPPPSMDSGTGPPVGTLRNESIGLIAFGTGGTEKLPGQTVDVYWGNTFTAKPDVAGVTSDDKGQMHVTVPAGARVGYHVRASSLVGDFWGLDDLRLIEPPLTEPVWQGVTHAKFEELSLAVTGDKGYKIPPGTGIVTGRVVDCQHRYMRYASIVLLDVTDGLPGKELKFGTCGSDLCILYLSDTELPAQSLTWTSRSGLFAMIGVPTTRKLRAVAIGYATDGSSFEVGHRDLEVKEGAITNQYIEGDNP